MDGKPQRGRVVVIARLRRQLQHTDEVGGDPLADCDPIARDERERLDGVEPLHDHHRSADRQHGYRPGVRRSMVEG